MTSKFDLRSLPLFSCWGVLCLRCLLLLLARARLVLLELFLGSIRCFALFVSVSFKVVSTTEEAGNAWSQRGIGRGHGKGSGRHSDVSSNALALFILECRLEFVKIK